MNKLKKVYKTYIVLLFLVLILIISSIFSINKIKETNNLKLYSLDSKETLETAISNLKEEMESKGKNLTAEVLPKINNEQIDVGDTNSFPIKVVCDNYEFQVNSNFEVNVVGEANGTIVNYSSKYPSYTNNQIVNNLIKINDDSGIKTIEYPNGHILNGHNKKNITIDYTVSVNNSNIFTIINSKGEKRIKDIYIDKIDTLSPNDFSASTTIEKRKLTISGSTTDKEPTSNKDTLSGIEKYEYYLKKDTETDYKKLDSNIVEKLATGIYNTYIIAYDRAGNTTTTPIETFEMENTAPSKPTIVAYPQTEGNVIKKGRSLTITAEGSIDEQGDDFTYVFDGRIAEVSNAYTVGTHTIRAKAVDSEGLESEWAEYTFTVSSSQAVNIELYNENEANFDVRALDGTIQTTFSNGGYTSVIKVGNSQQNLTSTTGTINNVTFVRKTVLNSEQNHIKTTYTVTNNSGTEQTIGISVHADIQIGSNDSAPIYANNTGFRMTDGTYTFYVYLKNMPEVDNVDTIWYGHYSQRTDHLWDSTTATSVTGIDSGMAFSWNNRKIQPGETKTYSFIFDVE